MTVIANIYAVHNDPAHWENPGEFRPERFLTPDGKVLKDEQWIPFSLGKSNESVPCLVQDIFASSFAVAIFNTPTRTYFPLWNLIILEKHS